MGESNKRASWNRWDGVIEKYGRIYIVGNQEVIIQSIEKFDEYKTEAI